MTYRGEPVAVDLPCDSEPHGEALPMSTLMAMAAEPNHNLRDADGHPWSPGEGSRAVAEARRDQADAAFRRALSEFCGALRIPVPLDWRRAQQAFAGVGLIGPR